MQHLQQLKDQFSQAHARAKSLLAQSEGRNVSAQEHAAIAAAVEDAKNLKARLDKVQGDATLTFAIDQLTAGMAPTGSSGTNLPGRPTGRTLGERFVNSDVMKYLMDTRNSRAGAWSSPAAELFATTLDESSGSGGPIVISDYQSGILPSVTRPLVVADLLSQGTTTSSSVTFLAESTFTNAAAAVAEGAAKPESTLVFTQTTEVVRKIAHWLPVTDELMSDVAQMQSYIDGRLRLGVQLAEDDALLNGSGVAPILTGLLTRSGLSTTIARGSDTNADAIAKMMAQIATSTNLVVDGIILHPTNYLTVQLQKNAAGDYYDSGGPFGRPMNPPTLWGVPCALTTACPLGTAFVGAFKAAAQIFRNGGLRVEASNSHSDFFVRNLIAIRAETRLALVTYRNSAMGKVTGLV